jgi:N6-adenosine-specific RNA methylase IME4
VIDPPWEVKKIIREVRPNQKEFDYPTMTIEEIKAFPIKDLMVDNCHVFLWTTQKYLPYAFDILKEWGLTYVFAMVWHKNGGFQPYGLPQYNCEFVLYAHKGNPKFIDTKDFFCCFNADRGKHSEKPDSFYDVIDRVCDGNKIDIFARKQRKVWEVYGNEVI